MNLKDKVAIVTGGSMGIGEACVRGFCSAGAIAVFCARHQGQGEALARELNTKDQGACLFVKCDVSKPDQVDALVKETVERYGRVDYLVNNAGICPVVSWDQTTLVDWNHVLEVNLTGMFICTKAVIPIMRKQKYGRIVYISSTAASVGSLTAHVAYGVSKAGIIALMKSVAKEFAVYGITANAVSPGTIDTPLTNSFSSQTKKLFLENCVMKRRGQPGEVADAVLYLVSDWATYVTGHTLHVDGGFALR